MRNRRLLGFIVGLSAWGMVACGDDVETPAGKDQGIDSVQVVDQFVDEPDLVSPADLKPTADLPPKEDLGSPADLAPIADINSTFDVALPVDAPPSPPDTTFILDGVLLDLKPSIDSATQSDSILIPDATPGLDLPVGDQVIDTLPADSSVDSTPPLPPGILSGEITRAQNVVCNPADNSADCIGDLTIMAYGCPNLDCPILDTFKMKAVDISGANVYQYEFPILPAGPVYLLASLKEIGDSENPAGKGDLGTLGVLSGAVVSGTTSSLDFSLSALSTTIAGNLLLNPGVICNSLTPGLDCVGDVEIHAYLCDNLNCTMIGYRSDKAVDLSSGSIPYELVTIPASGTFHVTAYLAESDSLSGVLVGDLQSGDLVPVTVSSGSQANHDFVLERAPAVVSGTISIPPNICGGTADNDCQGSLIIAFGVCDYVGSALVGCKTAGLRMVQAVDLSTPGPHTYELAALVHSGTFHLEAYLLENGFQQGADGMPSLVAINDLWHPTSEVITLSAGSVLTQNLSFERPTPTLHGTISIDANQIACGSAPEDCVGSLRVMASPCLVCDPVSHQTWENIDLSSGKTFDYYLLDMPSGPTYIYAWLYEDPQPQGLGNPGSGDLVNSSFYSPPFDYPIVEVVQGQDKAFNTELILRIP